MVNRTGKIKFTSEMFRAGWALRINLSEKKWEKVDMPDSREM